MGFVGQKTNGPYCGCGCDCLEWLVEMAGWGSAVCTCTGCTELNAAFLLEDNPASPPPDGECAAEYSESFLNTITIDPATPGGCGPLVNQLIFYFISLRATDTGWEVSVILDGSRSIIAGATQRIKYTVDYSGRCHDITKTLTKSYEQTTWYCGGSTLVSDTSHMFSSPETIEVTGI